MATLSLRQDDTRLTSQVALIEVMDGKTLKRSDVKLDFTREMRVIAKSMIKKINSLRVGKDLPIILPRFHYYQIG